MLKNNTGTGMNEYKLAMNKCRLKDRMDCNCESNSFGWFKATMEITENRIYVVLNQNLVSLSKRRCRFFAGNTRQVEFDTLGNSIQSTVPGSAFQLEQTQTVSITEETKAKLK